MLPKNKFYPDGYGFTVNPCMVNKNYFKMPDNYHLDICIDSLLRESGVRYKHYKILASQLYEEFLYKYEVKMNEPQENK